MTKQDFKELVSNKIVYLDGAMGSNLIKRGMPQGVCPEKWILENRDVVVQLQKEYVEAGTNILYAPTFTANRPKLQEYGLENDLVRINKELVAISKEAADGKALVAGDITMTGIQLKPMGTLDIEELLEIYKDLRDEIKKRVDERNKYFVQAIMFFGALLAVGYTGKREYAISALVAGPWLSLLFLFLIYRSFTIGENIKLYDKIWAQIK